MDTDKKTVIIIVALAVIISVLIIVGAGNLSGME